MYTAKASEPILTSMTPIKSAIGVSSEMPSKAPRTMPVRAIVTLDLTDRLRQMASARPTTPAIDPPRARLLRAISVAISVLGAIATLMTIAVAAMRLVSPRANPRLV
jgi:hypothetical protein